MSMAPTSPTRLNGLDPARTLVIVSSKTFTTQETMTNAASARANGSRRRSAKRSVGDHFAAVSTRLDKVAAFGIAPDRVFGFWDWVGGRYSMWSSIGLSLTIAIGPEHFEEFLRGGFDVDQHFQQAPLAENIPVLMALIGVWHRNVWGFPSQAVIPYDQRLARFPAYLQQLDMESNGKSVMRDGTPSPRATGPIVFGEPGHQQPARLLPTAASGHGNRAGRFSGRGAADRSRRPSPRAALRQLPRPERSLFARQHGKGSARDS